MTFNAGSSTVKIGLFEIEAAVPRRIAKGVVDFRRSPARFELDDGGEEVALELAAKGRDDPEGVLDEVLGRLSERFDMSRMVAAGHRVVHGGDAFAGPVRLDEKAIAAIGRLTVLAPLHQPQSLRLIETIRKLRPGLLQTASFDTAFHRTNAEIVSRFAIPRALHDEGIRRYGFHGLSYKFVAGELSRRFPAVAAGKVVAAHLGSGASLCGLDAGESRDSSMGFSTLDGIPMATRCGAIDPGVLLHLLGAGGRTVAEVEDILYHRSGLLGVSGTSADSRELLESDRPEAREAIELFCLRIAGETARLAATLGGLDGFVFTAGVGENQPRVRAGVCDRLAWLGVELDAEANAAGARQISRPSSRVSVFVVPTDEEQVIADEALAILR